MAEARPNVRLVIAALIGFLVVLLFSFRRALTLPFLNDDYLILDKVIHRTFNALWSTETLLFNWYRPWSREFHYWTLVRLFGPNEPAFHFASFGLWLADMLLYFTLLRRLGASLAVAALATICAASLALWSAPLLWVAGVQELWFIGFALALLLALSFGRLLWACAFLALALLSKEVAAILPAVAAFQLLLIHRSPIKQVLRTTAILGSIVGSWAVVHPTLRDRLFGHLQVSPETVNRPSSGMTVVKTVLAQVNLDAVPQPDGGWGSVLPSAALMAFVGIGLAFLILRRASEGSASVNSSRDRLLFGVAWCALGWAILLLPSIGWHPYYGAFGTLGFWFAAATVLATHRRLAVLVVATLLVLREARLETPSWDWGTYWYQRRAGSFLSGIRSQMFGYYPSLPHHSRLYFANLPNNIGLVAGDGPAFRIWYRDSTLKAGFYSQYVPRSGSAAAGRDYYFRYDPQRGLTEVLAGSEPPSRVFDEQWEHNQRVLASLFLQSGDLVNAAHVYSKLWHYRQATPDYALYAAGVYGALGDSTQYQAYVAVLDRLGRGPASRAALRDLIQAARQFAPTPESRTAPEP